MELEEGWAHMQVSVPLRAPGRPSWPCPRLPASHAHLLLQAGIEKLIRILEGEQESSINAQQYMMLYT